MILKNAWRNIWRNKRRTIITISSGFFAVFFAIVMRATQLGTYDKMTSDVVNAYTGYIQIHKKGYWEDKTIDNSFERNEALEKQISEIEHVTAVVPRMESFALASHGTKTKGVIVVGIEPEIEETLSKLGNKLTKGELLTADDNDVLVAEGLAKFLNISLGDTLVLLGQGYHGISAAGKYHVKGLLYFPAGKLNKSMIYLNLKTAQELYSTYNMLSSLSIGIDEAYRLDPVFDKVEKQSDLEIYEVMTWKEMLVELVQMIQTDNIGGIIMLIILYIIIGFGIFGTVVMMTSERTREFSILVALGTRKGKLMQIVVLETFFLGLIAVVLGSLAALPIVYYYHINPILLTGTAAESMISFGMEPVMPMALRFDFFLNQAYTILLIIGVSITYPIAKLRFLSVIKGMKH